MTKGGLADAERHRADQAVCRGRERQADGDDDVPHAGPDRGHHGQGQHQGGKGHEPVHDPLDHQVRPAAEVARDQPDQGAGGGAEQDGGDTDAKRDACSVRNPAEHVAPEIVGAEPVRLARRPESLGRSDLFGLVHGDAIGEHGRQEEEADDHRPQHAHGLAPREVPYERRRRVRARGRIGRPGS
jgi:hypothetical protein